MEQKGWAIIGVHGMYTGWWFTRTEAIKSHIGDLGITWQQAKKKGDSAVRVKVKVYNH